MQLRILVLLGAFAAIPAAAQPIIIPLEPQKRPEQPSAPVASAPPVAPPQAAPAPPSSGYAEQSTRGHAEEAYQPPTASAPESAQPQ